MIGSNSCECHIFRIRFIVAIDLVMRCYLLESTELMYASSSLPSTFCSRLNARRKVPRSTARTAHERCTHAPRPGKVRRGSGITFPSIHTTRSSSEGFSRLRQSIQLRKVLLLLEEVLMTTVRSNSTCQPYLSNARYAKRFEKTALLLRPSGIWGVRVNIDAPARQSCRKTCILTVFANCQRKLVVRNRHFGRTSSQINNLNLLDAGWS